jgi:hypothetical protein
MKEIWYKVSVYKRKCSSSEEQYEVFLPIIWKTFFNLKSTCAVKLNKKFPDEFSKV